MNERRNAGDRSPQRRPSEGVRIIRADEAQAALDAGEAAGRRPDDELRFGDVPPAPSGPRSPHRFPLPIIGGSGRGRSPAPAGPAPGGDDPSLEGEYELQGADPHGHVGWSARRPSTLGRCDQRGLGDRRPDGRVRHPGSHGWAGAGRVRPARHGAPPESGGSPTYGAPPDLPGAGGPTPTAEPAGSFWTTAGPAPLAPPEQGITVTGGGTELPPWTDPPTGEVPRHPPRGRA